MKQKDIDCKIVQDLLPNYVENLTDEVTNAFIEEHIANCPECANMLQNMNGEIKLEHINQDKEIKYLKNIRKRVKRTILTISTLVILIACGIIGYTYNASKIEVNNYTFLVATYVKYNIEGTENGNVYGTLIAVFDENDRCKSVRGVETGYLEQATNEQENIGNLFWDEFPINYYTKRGKMHYNINIWNGMEKNNIIQLWQEIYNIVEIEEI